MAHLSSENSCEMFAPKAVRPSRIASRMQTVFSPVPTAMGSMPSPIPMGIPVQVLTPPPGGFRYLNLFDTLLKNPGLYVKEQINLTEILTGIDMESTFRVNAWNPAMGAENPKTGKGEELMVMKEESSCLQRIFCRNHRAFRIGIAPTSRDVATYVPGMDGRKAIFGHPDAMVIDRPFKCTLCCWNRPVVHMSHNAIGRFATVKNPCQICAFHFDVHPATADDGGIGPVAEGVVSAGGKKWFAVHGSVCQPGVWCFCPFGECARVRLQIYDGADVERQRPIGEVARVFPGCCRSIATEADDFTIAFPADASAVQRASLVSSVILLNYLFYESNKKNNNNH